MPVSRSPQAESSLMRDWIDALRYWLGGRRGLVFSAIALVGFGLWLNWGWLVSLGVAPLILSILPCAAMCALGLCMHHKGKADPSKTDPTDRDDSDVTG
ncbi:MAG: hypothetical protein R3F54_14220 [Alphaproteobacteria bacterium]